ncbi:MAG: hypothetical protein PHS41_04300 [Victivallaceae bacterium]|nr:hypothetical protein [Victivallaceae bacterium]
MPTNAELIFRREHDFHRANRAVWQRSFDAYAGGEAYIRQALIRHVSEIELEFQERLHRAYYFNYPRRIAQLITQYILSSEPQRENCDLDLVEDFSRTGLRTGEVMRQFSTLLNICGAAAIAVEMPFFEGVADGERKHRERLRPAARAISLLDIPDWSHAADGKLDWIILEQEEIPPSSPFELRRKIHRRTLYTRNEYFVFERDSEYAAREIARGTHNLGEVPVVFLCEPEGYGLKLNHYFEDVVRISDAIFNNESEAQMNVVKQMFGLLVISENFARSAATPIRDGENNAEKSVKFSHLLARSAAIWESPEERGVSRYISPSGVSIDAIRGENLALKKELFDLVGMALSLELRQVQSAESKAWDQHNARQFLTARADMLEQSEIAVWHLMHCYDPSIPVPSVTYNRDFAVTDLSESVQSLLSLKELSDNKDFHDEITRTAVFLLGKIRKLAPERQQAILQGIARGENQPL